jgi:hypothetical protein
MNPLAIQQWPFSRALSRLLLRHSRVSGESRHPVDEPVNEPPHVCTSVGVKERPGYPRGSRKHHHDQQRHSQTDYDDGVLRTPE